MTQTSASPFHSRATHVDAHGMPVAGVDEFPYHPTPCCGAAASCNEWGMYCKRCYEDVEMDYGCVPVKPFRSLADKGTTFHAPPVVGGFVHYTTVGDGWVAQGSGYYLGVALDEEGGEPYHYFVNGEINGGPQRSHGFPAEPGTPTTTDLTPTALIQAAERD